MKPQKIYGYLDEEHLLIKLENNSICAVNIISQEIRYKFNSSSNSANDDELIAFNKNTVILFEYNSSNIRIYTVKTNNSSLVEINKLKSNFKFTSTPFKYRDQLNVSCHSIKCYFQDEINTIILSTYSKQENHFEIVKLKLNELSNNYEVQQEYKIKSNNLKLYTRIENECVIEELQPTYFLTSFNCFLVYFSFVMHNEKRKAYIYELNCLDITTNEFIMKPFQIEFEYNHINLVELKLNSLKTDGFILYEKLNTNFIYFKLKKAFNSHNYELIDHQIEIDDEICESNSSLFIDQNKYLCVLCNTHILIYNVETMTKLQSIESTKPTHAALTPNLNHLIVYEKSTPDRIKIIQLYNQNRKVFDCPIERVDDMCCNFRYLSICMSEGLISFFINDQINA